MGNPPLQSGNKVYTLKPKFITSLQEYFRKLKIKLYKKKMVRKSKTSYQRFYHIKFKVNIKDDINPHSSEVIHEAVVPAKAFFFAKMFLARSIKEKIELDFVDWEEMTNEEHDQFLISQEEFYENKEKKIPECEHQWVQVGRKSENRIHCTECHDEQTISED
jgi:hypothetical protein